MSNTTEAGERLFTQEDVNRIVQDRLAKERAKNPDGESAVRAEFEAYKQQIEAEKQKAVAEATMQKRFDDACAGAKWINDHTRRGVYAEFAAAIAAPEHAGKTDAQIYASLTTDRDGYFQNPNPPADGAPIMPLPTGYDPIRKGMGLERKE